jgi:prepilin-type N-terminal cleavage/methylation domain-containing protein
MKTHRGFTLWEILVVIGILPIFMLVSTQLFRAILITADSSQRMLSAHAVFDSAAGQMWRDIFNAKQIRSAGSKTILITERDGDQIHWQSEQANLLRAAADQRHYNVTRGLQLQADVQGQSIQLRLLGSRGTEDQIDCASPADFWSSP